LSGKVLRERTGLYALVGWCVREVEPFVAGAGAAFGAGAGAAALTSAGAGAGASFFSWTFAGAVSAAGAAFEASANNAVMSSPSFEDREQ
jgi:hypothetical protein